MYKHAPRDYECPFCAISSGLITDDILTRPTDVVYQDHIATAFISAERWLNNPGHTILIPNVHYENLYDLPSEFGSRGLAITKTIALAQKEVYGCEGVALRQHNEPEGGQTVWHFHMHIIPRYTSDSLGQTEYVLFPPEERLTWARPLRKYLRSAFGA